MNSQKEQEQHMGFGIIKFLMVGCLSLLVLVNIAMGQNNNEILWVSQETQTINKTNLSTGDSQIMLMGVGRDAQYLYVDSVNSQLYWMAETDIRRMDIDGSNPAILYDDVPLGNIGGFTVDVDNQYLYWSESDSARIRRLKIGSTTAETLIEGEAEMDYPWDVAIHGDSLYIIQDGVMVSDLEGNGLRTLIDGYARSLSIAIDDQNDKVYWTTRDDGGQILRANLDGTNVEVVTASANPQGISIDAAAGTMNWISIAFNKKVLKADLDGNNEVTLFDTPDYLADTDVGSNGTVYWSKDMSSFNTGTGKIWKKTSRDSTELWLKEMGVADIVVDYEGQRAFWIDYTGGQGILQSDLSFQQIDTVFDGSNMNNLSKLAIDRSNNRIYYASGGAIYANNYSGSASDSIAAYVGNVSGLVVNPSNQTVYWTDNGSTTFGNLKSVNLNTGETTTHVEQNLTYARSLKVNLQSGKLFWATGDSFSGGVGIKAADADGTNIAYFYAQQDQELPQSIAINQEDGGVYFSDYYAGMIYRVDGELSSTIVLEGIRNPMGFSILTGTSTDLERGSNDLAVGYRLESNYPNPFNPTTMISYSLARSEHVRLTVYDLLGREVAVIADGFQTAGRHQVSFEAKGLASGTYIYRLETDQFTHMRKMTLMK